MKLTFTDLHVHSEFSLQDGMIRVANKKDPKHIKADIILSAERRNTGAVTMTDHGNCYGQAVLASVCNYFGMKHIPGCEFYMSTDSRLDKSYARRGDAYMHINSWVMNREGYANMCRLQNASFTEGFYYVPRIDKELLEKYHSGIIWSDACIGGVICNHINKGDIERAYAEFMWYLELLGDDFYIEYHNHHLPQEEVCNKYKVEWANKHGVPIIACTDAHYTNKEDADAHRALLCIQYGNWYDNPAFEGFSGDGYHLMSESELLERFPVEYLNNTQLIVDKCSGNIIEFGNTRPPRFDVPQWFKDKIDRSRQDG